MYYSDYKYSSANRIFSDFNNDFNVCNYSLRGIKSSNPVSQPARLAPRKPERYSLFQAATLKNPLTSFRTYREFLFGRHKTKNEKALIAALTVLATVGCTYIATKKIGALKKASNDILKTAEKEIHPEKISEETNTVIDSVKKAEETVVKDVKTKINKIFPGIIQEVKGEKPTECILNLTGEKGENLGCLSFLDGPLSQFGSAGLPETYNRGFNSLYIYYLESSGKQKGTGSKLIEEVVKRSIKCGHEGRVFVSANPIGNGNPKWRGQSPVPFYYKQGFRFEEEELNEIVEKAIAAYEQTGKYPDLGRARIGNMFLPEEIIKSFPQ